MKRSVVKHSYVKGVRGQKKALAHINYIEHREGRDREEGEAGGGRRFFDDVREGIAGREVKEEIKSMPGAGLVVHKLMVSPGVQGVDMKAFTRELLAELGQTKGLDLEWRGVVHGNTDHVHAHVVVMGQDRNGRLVELRVKDYELLREIGDRYLEREHKFERMIDRELEMVVADRELSREGGDERFNSLIFGNKFKGLEKLVLPERWQKKDRDKAGRRKKERKKLKEMEELRRQEQLIVKAMRMINRGSEIGRTVRGRQRIYEQRGRLVEFHALYVNAREQKRLEDLALRSGRFSESIAKEVEQMRQFSERQSGQIKQEARVCKLLGMGQGRAAAREAGRQQSQGDVQVRQQRSRSDETK